MNRRFFLMSILASALALSACGRKPKMAPLAAGSTVLAFGDSVTFGTGARPGEDWPTLLATATAWKVVNAGVSGDTAQNGRERIAGVLAETRPSLVIVEIGGNDFLKRRAASAVKEDIRAILRQVKASGSQAVLVAVPELSLMGALTRKPADAPLYAELAKEENVPLIADVFSGILGRPELCADQIHPNAAGYRQMAEGFLNALRQMGLLR